ncbi:MAG: TIGR04325 family methyltransferase [Patescibacteria group bacterium]
MIKNLIKNITPPIILKLIKGRPRYGFFGNYKAWHEARADSGGYDDEKILEKVKDSLLKVKNGQAAYERDSVLFDKIQYSWPVLSALLWIASQNNNELILIDFGGSLGSSYFQNMGFLKHLKKLKWNIVEQKNFVECGRKFFEDEHLKFFGDIEDCLKENNINVFLASSSFQYLEDPYAFMKKIVDLDFKYIVIDRTPYFKEEDLITVQKVNPKIYDASYPAWIINESKFIKILEPKYDLIADWQSSFEKIALRGFILRNKKNE